jgi:hypothetical protein
MCDRPMVDDAPNPPLQGPSKQQQKFCPRWFWTAGMSLLHQAFTVKKEADS